MAELGPQKFPIVDFNDHLLIPLGDTEFGNDFISLIISLQE